MSAAGSGGGPATIPERSTSAEPSNAAAVPSVAPSDAAPATSAPAHKFSLTVGEEPACGCCIAEAYRVAGYELDEVCLCGGELLGWGGRCLPTHQPHPPPPHPPQTQMDGGDMPFLPPDIKTLGEFSTFQKARKAYRKTLANMFCYGSNDLPFKMYRHCYTGPPGNVDAAIAALNAGEPGAEALFDWNRSYSQIDNLQEEWRKDSATCTFISNRGAWVGDLCSARMRLPARGAPHSATPPPPPPPPAR